MRNFHNTYHPKTCFLLFSTFLSLISCGGGDGGGDTPPAPEVKLPTAATLSAPTNNNECLDGSDVNFSWQAGTNNDSFILNIKDLNSKEVFTHNSTTPSKTVTLTKGVPYSWYVTSMSSSSSKKVYSPTWKFYLAGDSVSNYAPFPPDLLSPTYGAALNAGSIQFTWSASDADGDNLTFSVLLDQNTNPSTVISSDLTNNSINANLSESGTYYWKIIATDPSGSNTASGVSTFVIQ